MTGRTALVVGGTSGIGLATARLLDAAGATVHIAGRSKERLDTVSSSDPELIGHQADGGNRDEIAAVADAIGSIDWLIITLSGNEGPQPTEAGPEKPVRVRGGSRGLGPQG
jgi:NAD(P)-dependent dehydrogenase (short-subunit alcohol dehydrogenase family)